MSCKWANQAGIVSIPLCGHWLDTMALPQSAHELRSLTLLILSGRITCVERTAWRGRALKAPLFYSNLTIGLFWTALWWLCSKHAPAYPGYGAHRTSSGPNQATETAFLSATGVLLTGTWLPHQCCWPYLLSFLTWPPLPSRMLHFHVLPPLLYPLTLLSSSSCLSHKMAPMALSVHLNPLHSLPWSSHLLLCSQQSLCEAWWLSGLCT